MMNPPPSDSTVSQTVAHNYGLLVCVAKTFTNDIHDVEEYIQIGAIGLIKAIRNYDSDLGRFDHYARVCVTNEILRELSKRRRPRHFHLHDVIDKERVNINEYLPSNLTIEEKNIVELKLYNYTAREIADILGIPRKSVKYRIRQTLNKVKAANEAQNNVM